MPKRKTQAGIKADPASDVGPAFIRNKAGRLRQWGGAADVVIEHRPDPDQDGHIKLVRGARRRNSLRDLFHRGVITKTQFDAVERFTDDISMSGTNGGLVANLMAVKSSGASGMSLPERQLFAIARVRTVWTLLNLNVAGVFSHVIFDNQTLESFDNDANQRHGRAGIQFRETLDKLVCHYDGRRATA